VLSIDLLAPDPFYSDETATIYRGDVLRVLPALPSDSVDVVIADPPYSSGGRTLSERDRPTSVKYQQSGAPTLPDFVGDSRDQRSHTYWNALWLSEALRVTRPGGVAFVWSDWRQLAATIDGLQAGGWVFRGVVTWHKSTARPVRGRLRLDSEFAVFGSNGKLVARDVYPSSVIKAAPPKRRVHTAQKPVEVLAHLLQLAPPGGVVLDPFLGSGSTLVASRAAGLSGVGVEIDPLFCDLSAQRLREVTPLKPAARSRQSRWAGGALSARPPTRRGTRAGVRRSRRRGSGTRARGDVRDWRCGSETRGHASGAGSATPATDGASSSRTTTRRSSSS
jgi:site-specific DNA-methyltransferase (adenine-specific)